MLPCDSDLSGRYYSTTLEIEVPHPTERGRGYTTILEMNC